MAVFTATSSHRRKVYRRLRAPVVAVCCAALVSGPVAVAAAAPDSPGTRRGGSMPGGSRHSGSNVAATSAIVRWFGALRGR